MPVSISDFIELSNAAKTADELFRAFSAAIGSYGYDRFMYSAMTGGHPHEWEKVPSIARNYPEDWIAYYIEKGYMAIDPLRQIAFQARKPVVWDDVPKLISLTPEQERCLRQGIDAGLHNGIGVPFHGPYGEVAGIGLASGEKNVELTPAIVSTLGLLSNQLHVAHIELTVGSVACAPLSLTEREKEVLLWCARGKSNWAIGEILNISEHAVKFHVANFIAKLEVDSRITAVLKAIRLRLICP